MMRPIFVFLISCLFSPALFAADAQVATVLQDTALHAEPYSDAQKLTTLKAKQQVTIIKRKGGWYQVAKGEVRGWLRMSRVRFGSGTQAKGNGDGEGLAQTLSFLTTGRSGAEGVTVATGIRGLESADVANATPNHQAVGRLNSYQIQAEQARAFARNAQLNSQPLGYIEAE